MKINTLKEEDIRPKVVFDEFLNLAKKDIKAYFATSLRTAIVCPACTSDGEQAFQKNEFDYALCPECQTLFVSPRPAADAFNIYYTDAPSVKYWATTFYHATAKARREKIWKPKAKLVYNVLKKYDALNHQVIDIGGGYGIFAKEMELLTSMPVTVIEPNRHLANICRSSKLNVVEKFLESVRPDELPTKHKTFVSFELFEHLHDPSAFLKHLFKIMQPGDLFLFTTLSGTGVDIQVLWENSKSISPPHHLNFFNPASVKILLERLNFCEVVVTTPGKLDVDILCNNRELIRDRFWQNFTAQASESVKDQWQELITATGLSSHMMVICRVPNF